MLHKKPAILLSSYINISTLNNPSPSSTSCRQATLTRPASQPQTRNYAQHIPHSSSQHEDRGGLSWPDPVHPHNTPTPYQILSHSKDQPYTKARFYSLVKIYHPDQCSHPSSPAFPLPHAVRLERYRLLVAAHTILSDPEKRSAYDSCGYGWAGHKPNFQYASSYQRSWERKKEWPPGQDPMYNATWEDWERWYARDEEKAQPFMSNLGFVSLILSLALIGGVGQATRATNFGSNIMEQRDKRHDMTSKELAKAREASRDSSTMYDARDERIQAFLRNREASTYGGGDAYDRLLPDDSEKEG